MSCFVTCVILVFAPSLASAQTEPVRGRKESRGRASFNQTLAESVVTLELAQAKHASSPVEFGGVLRHTADSLAVLNQTTEVPSNARTGPATSSFEQFKASLRRITFHQDTDGIRYLAETPNTTKVTNHVIEEDIYLNEFDLFFYQQAVALKNGTAAANPNLFVNSFTSADPASRSASDKLRGMVEEGRIERWVPGSTLTYCLLKWTFGGNTQQYQQVCDNMAAAAKYWSAVCNIKFQHRQDLDGAPANTIFPTEAQQKRQVLFVVGRYPSMDAVAIAFFPNDSIHQRFLLINPGQYFTSTFDKIGVLRHELGHVLGYRHEHICPDAPVWDSEFCMKETAVGSAPIDQARYERTSVMHYPCNALGSPAPAANLAIKLSESDVRGAQSVYDPPGTNLPINDPKVFKTFDANP